MEVTNTGTAAGKSVVQVYLQQPYTAGGIEKSAVQLAAFAKTDVLQPGESCQVELTVDRQDMASYDYKDAKTYVLDAGDYYFALGNGAHDALNNILAARGKTVADGMDYEGDAALTYRWSNPAKELLNQSYSGNEITNRLDSASLEYYGYETVSDPQRLDHLP